MADIQKFLDKGGVSTLWTRIAEELNKKAGANDVYTKSEVDQKINAIPQYDDSALKERVAANEAALGVLNGDSSAEGSVAYQIAAIVAGADASFDTLKEIADWISSHNSDVTNMNSSIKANTDAVAALQKLVGSEAVATQIANAIAAANLSQYASAEDLADAVLKIATNESEVTSLKSAVSGHTTDISNLTSRVDGIVAGGGEPNVINNIKVNGVVQSIAADKSVNIEVPTIAALTSEEIDAAIAAAAV